MKETLLRREYYGGTLTEICCEFYLNVSKATSLVEC